MARKKRHSKKRTHKRRHTAKRGRARARSGFGRSVSSGGYSLNTLPRILLSAAILRFGSGVVYWWFRSQFQKAGADPKKVADNFNKAKIIFPTLIAVASAKKWIPDLPGLTPMAVAMAFYSVVENFDSLRDLFDLKMMDEKPASGKTMTALPTAGMSARTWAQTRQQLQTMHLPTNGFEIDPVGEMYSRNGYRFGGYEMSGYNRSGISSGNYSR